MADTIKIWHILCLIYPIVYVGSIPLTLLLKRYSSYISSFFFVNFLEQYIVNNGFGYFYFTVIYWINAYPFHTNKLQFIKYAKLYVANTIWVGALIEWCFGSPIFERISILAGAHCTIPNVFKEYQCYKKDGNWINPFDSSSHYTLLISCSLLIWYQLLNSNLINFKLHQYLLIDLEIQGGQDSQQSETDEITSKHQRIAKSMTFISITFLTLWFISYLITSIFFHTIPEKLVGLFCGLFIPLMIEYI